MYSTLERLDKGNLKTLLKQPETDSPGRESNPGLRSGRRALKQRAFRTSTNNYLEHLHTVLARHNTIL